MDYWVLVDVDDGAKRCADLDELASHFRDSPLNWSEAIHRWDGEATLYSYDEVAALVDAMARDDADEDAHAAENRVLETAF